MKTKTKKTVERNSDKLTEKGTREENDTREKGRKMKAKKQKMNATTTMASRKKK